MKLLKSGLLLAVGILFLGQAQAQEELTQTVRGKVVDTDTKFPLVGVQVIMVDDTTMSTATVTDLDGKFVLEEVSAGRHTLAFRYMGYREQFEDINVNTGRQLVMTVELEESSTEMEEVVITGSKRGEVRNEMATVSARQFSVEETDRYAGSRGDPARMASNFAGVQGADDSRNDLIVRGNSPLGVLYRVEGVNIPNPNHFAIAGTAGGPVGILNNKVLANSDFFTGAFPAEYGNTVSSVFDIGLRNGNNQQTEFTGQFGMFGVEALVEGPINKEKGSSYLLSARYSTAVLFHLLGIDIGTNAVPKYGDMSFKLNFPQENGANLSVFGIAGASDIDIVISKDSVPSVDLFAENDRDQYFGTYMGIGGIKYTKAIDRDTYYRITFAGSVENQHTEHRFIWRHLDTDSLYVVDSIYTMLNYNFDVYKALGAFSMTKKFGRQHVLKYGVNSEMHYYNMVDSVLADEEVSGIWEVRWNAQETAFLIEPYAQWKWKPSEKLTLTLGLHSMYYSFSNSLSPIEPRGGMEWKITEKQSLSAGIGLHSQLQPLYTYLYEKTDTMTGDRYMHNRDMDFTKSMHYVLAYSASLSGNVRMRIETYYQDLFNIPVEANQSSAFSLVNQGSGFQRFFPEELQNTGTGLNYGVELTLEKFFNNKFFFLMTGSVYESKFRGSDGILRNTSYNGNYAFNLLGTKEFEVSQKSTISVGGKLTMAGGRRYGLVDTTASLDAKEIIFEDEDFNEYQFRDYFRLDFKVNYKINAKKVTHEIAIDLVNALDTDNILSLSYGGPDNPIVTNYQLGRLPIFYYRIEF